MNIDDVIDELYSLQRYGSRKNIENNILSLESHVQEALIGFFIHAKKRIDSAYEDGYDNAKQYGHYDD